MSTLSLSATSIQPTKLWPSTCSHCSELNPRPQPQWECQSCKKQLWQPDDSTNQCNVCGTSVRKGNRHHCRFCGYIICSQCSVMQSIKDFGLKPQRICRLCHQIAAPSESLHEGYITLETCNGDYPCFGKIEHSILYFYHSSSEVTPFEKLDIHHVQILDVHATVAKNAFCLTLGRLQKRVMIRTATGNEKESFIRAIQKQAEAGNISGKEKEKTSAIHCATDDSLTERDFLKVDLSDSSMEDSSLGRSYTATSILSNSPSFTTTQAISGANKALQEMRDFELIAPMDPIPCRNGAGLRISKVRERATGQLYVMRIVDAAQTDGANSICRLQDGIAKNAQTLRFSNPPFLCQVVRAFQTRRHVIIVTELFENCQSLLFLTNASGDKENGENIRLFSETEAKFYFAEVCIAFDFLHSVLGVVLGDFDPRDLILDESGHVVLMRLGFAEGVAKKRMSCASFPHYLAPEIGQSTKEWDKAADYWILGMLLHEMLTGERPVYVPSSLSKPGEFGLQFPEGEREEGLLLSENAKGLLTKLLKRNPQQRLSSWNELSKHAFFEGIDFEAIKEKDLVTF